MCLGLLEEYISTIGYIYIFCINNGPEALQALISESEFCYYVSWLSVVFVFHVNTICFF